MASSQDAVRIEPSRKRVRTYLDGELVADTTRPFLVWEVPYYPVYYVPAADVRAELIPSGATDRSPGRGDGEVLDVKVAGATAQGAALRYPASPLEQLRGLIRFDFSAMSEWLEEDEPIYYHARDPYSRVDILGSSRHVRIEVDGVTVAHRERGAGRPNDQPQRERRGDVSEPGDRRGARRARDRPALLAPDDDQRSPMVGHQRVEHADRRDRRDEK